MHLTPGLTAAVRPDVRFQFLRFSKYAEYAKYAKYATFEKFSITIPIITLISKQHIKFAMF